MHFYFGLCLLEVYAHLCAIFWLQTCRSLCTFICYILVSDL